MATTMGVKHKLGELKPLLGRVPGVVGVAIGGTAKSPRIIVMISGNETHTKERVAQLAKGVPYEVVVTGDFKTLKR